MGGSLEEAKGLDGEIWKGRVEVMLLSEERSTQQRIELIKFFYTLGIAKFPAHIIRPLITVLSSKLFNSTADKHYQYEQSHQKTVNNNRQ